MMQAIDQVTVRKGLIKIKIKIRQYDEVKTIAGVTNNFSESVSKLINGMKNHQFD